MASSRRASSRALTALTLGALTAGTLAISPLAQANPAGTGLVISEVYGGGGNTGAVFTHDYVELFNPTSGAVSLDGLSVQYRSATGTSAPTGVVALEPVTLPAGGHFLLQLATTNATVGAALPAPDEQDASVNLSATAGTVLLVNGSSALNPGTGAVQGATGLVDLVGFGGSNTYENLATETELQAQAPSATSSIARTPGDGTDADDSSTDFGVRSGAAEMSPAACGNVCVRDVPIAGVQGGGASSPLVGKRVTTRGVVTAAYPVGGLASFVIQTPGTGTSPGGASDAVVVAGAGAVPALSSGVTIGDYVDVTGTVAESFGRTQVTVGAASDVVERTDTVAPPTPLTTTWPGTDSARERLESMLLAPQGAFTVTDNFNVNRFAEIGIARGTEPLFQPTDVAEPDSPEAAAVAGRNAAALVTLDDGASTDFLSNATNKAIPLPWLTSDPTIRVGEPVTFTKPVVLDFSFGLWRFQPTQQLTADDAHQVSPVTFGDTRTSAPADVGGDLQVASMNVLNYFTDLGEELNGCTYFNDRAGDPVSISGGCTARGAAEQEDFERQQDKIVRAINSLGAEVVSLEEIENSAKYGHPRDESLSVLVDALNGDLGSAAWEYVPTPAQAPPVGGEDFIRTAFIYKPAAVEPVGESVIRPGGDTPADPFVNARDPLAQVFQPVGAEASDRFMLVVNHLKSKSSPPATPDPNADYGQGGFNADRVRQARALATWVDEVKADRGVEKVYLDGDFNSYTYEDPMRELYGAGFTNLAVAKAAGPHHTYLFGGLVGSLDHGLANDAALASTTGAAVWNINSVESVALEYSRHNYNATLFYDGTTPYRSSDHDPIVFGIDTTPDLPDTTLAVTVGPKNVKVGKTSVVVEASLTREDGAPASDGTVTVSLEGRVLGSVAVSGGEARVTLPAFDRIGEQVLTVDYDGGTSDPASRQVPVTVRR